MRVTPTCDPADTFFISQAANVQFSPDISFGGGQYMVVWVDGRAGGTSYRIYGSRVTPSGTVLEPSGIQIGATDAGYQYSPSITSNGSRFLAVWGYLYAPVRIMGRFINSDGSMSDTIKIADANSYVRRTSVAYSGSNYMVGWIDYSGTTYRAMGILLDTDGQPICSPFVIANSVYYYSLSLCYDGTQYCVSYILQSGYQYWGQKYDLTGTAIGAPFQISPSSYNHYYGEIIPGADNKYFNVWSEYRGSQYDVFGNLDISIIGIEEENRSTPVHKPCTASIISGPLHVPPDKTVRVFDIQGREVDPSHLQPGIFFIEIDGELTQKVIKIR